MVLGVVSVSFAAIFIRLADAPSLTLAFYRNALAAAVLLPLAVARHRDELRRLRGGPAAVTALAAVFLAVHFGTWIASLSFTTVSASVVLVSCSPIVTALGGRLLFAERAGRRTMAGIVVALVGTVVVTGGDLGLSRRYAGGDLLAIAGAVTAAGYLLAGRRMRQRLSLLTYVGVVYAVTALLLLPAAVASGAALGGFPARTWLWIVLLAAVPQGIGHTIFNHVLRDVEPTMVAIAIMGEPIGSTLLAWAIFGQAPPWSVVAGGALILAGIYVAVTAQGRPVPASEVPTE